MLEKEIEISDLDSFFNELFEMQKSGEYIFRGISDETQYSPGLFRKLNRRLPAIENYNFLRRYEMELLNRFARFSIQYLPPISHPLDWVASAQHFGLPTRLLDWTSDPFCGLFFSVFYNAKENYLDQEENDWYRLLVVNKGDHLFFENVPIFRSPYNLDFSKQLYGRNQISRDYEIFVYGLMAGGRNLTFRNSLLFNDQRNKDIMYQISNSFDSNDNPTKLFFCSISNSNPRVIAQNGLFQVPMAIDYKRDNGGLKKYIVDGCSKIYKINIDFRKEIIEKLLIMNVNSIRLFPDLASICDYITRTTDFWNYT